MSAYADDAFLSLNKPLIVLKGEPGFQGPMGPRGAAGEGLIGEKVQI